MNKFCLIFLGLLAIFSEASSSLRKAKSVVLQGEHCQYIDFANARSEGFGCVDGTKMVIKNK